MNDKNIDAPTLDELFVEIKFGKFHIIVVLIFGYLISLEATEIIILSLLGPILTCDWKINQLESSIISLVAIFGMFIGALLFGKFSDNFGRKNTILICVSGIFYYNLLCPMSPNIKWIIISRGLIGLFIGGIVVMIPTYLSEIMPISHRGAIQIFVGIFWVFGSYYLSIITVIIVPKYGWRLWSIISVCPMILLIPAIVWLPESPRFLLIVNRKTEAINTINRIAIMNNEKQITNVKSLNYKQPSLVDICHPTYALTTIICSYISLVIGLSYYGFVFSSPIISYVQHQCLQNMSRISELSIYTNSSIDNSCCFIQTWDTMKTVFISITGELISILLAVILVRFLKRKLYLQLLMLVMAIVFFLMNLCLSPVNMGILMMFGRGSGYTVISLLYLYISEVFPTTIRSFNTGLCSSFIRVGGFLSPFVVNVIMVKKSFLGSTLFYSIVNIIGVMVVFLLPFETKDRVLMQSVEEEINEKELLNTSYK